ncbi:Chemotaxis response regulator protein-glutamate methylesterase [bioreactor metagenome]|jgi:two-component system response regulator YesN|uniref:Chemotaxis response regulator protein-glutamate methylesterase n=1 Tax=bioreactor metagenome TaxID=1076179 RepID=A0A644X921_9ZZZZ|nr:response regulator [Sphaerochaeta sp.]
MAYTILLVDDETAVRDGIRSRTPWQTYNFEVIAEAGNGIEALELVEELHPDVVITDIRMPYLDGMELIQQIRSSHPATTLVILSGYDEFTYAQQAMRYEVSEYVLKPVSVEDLSKLLERLGKRLDEEIKRTQDQDRLRQAYLQALPLIREKFLVSLLTTVHPLSDFLLVSKAQEYGFDLDKDEFMVALIETNHYQDDPLQALAMLEVIEEALKKEGGGLAFQFENQIVIIFSAHSNNQSQYDSLFRKQTYRKAEHLKTYLEKFSFDAVMGVGSLVHSPSAITLSYHQALTALNYSSCYPEQSLFFISDLENTPTEESKGKLQEMKSNILIAVKMGSEEQVTDGVNQLLGEHLASLGVQEMQALLLELSSSLQDLAHSYGHSLFAIGEEEGRNLFLELASLTTLGKARRWYTRLCLNLRAMIAGQRENSHIQFIVQAKTLIAKHFTESGFGLEQICEMIGVSPSYFSSTFKREVGLSFVQYLTGMRMDRAKELLVKTEGKTYEIAQTVGFAEPNYFSFCFKRHVGLSPSQYRQANR